MSSRHSNHSSRVQKRKHSASVPPSPRGKVSIKTVILAGIALIGIIWLVVLFHGNSTETPLPTINKNVSNVPSTQSQSPTNSPGKDPAFLSLINKGNDLLSQGNSAEAVKVLTEAMQMNSQDEDVHYNLAVALVQAGKPQDAVLQYEEALKIMPNYVEAHNNLGNLLLKLGRTDEGIKHFEEAIKIMPDYASAHNNLGNALQKMGQPSNALPHFLQAAKANTNYWQAHFNAGSCYMTLGRPNEARTEFETVLRLHPNFKPAEAALEQIGAQR